MAGYDRNKEVLHRRYDWSEIPPSVAIVKMIGRYDDENESEARGGLDETLYHYFDVDALDTLVRDGSPITISLRIGDYDVEISNDTIRVTSSRPTPPPSQ